MNRATRIIAVLVAASALATSSIAAQGPPLASAWNIATSGNAASSGDLSFRVTPGDGSDPVDITVAVMSGASQDSVTRSISRSLSSQLRRDRYNVQPGENGNVLVSDSRGQPNFSLELVDSDVENVRVVVQSVTPAAPPTVPSQSTPANPVPPATPQVPGASLPPASAPPANASQPAAPPPANSPPLPNPSPPPNAPGGKGASAPEPNATPKGTPTNSPPPTG